jgi:hypothetical protein
MEETVVNTAVNEYLAACPADVVFPMGVNKIPDGAEIKLSQFLGSLPAMTQGEIASVRDELMIRQSYQMVIFAVRMAVWAVRVAEANKLISGLFGFALGGVQTDWRDFLGALSITEDCATRLELDFRCEIEGLRHLFDTTTIQTIEGYLSRSAEMRAVEVMGFKAESCSDGLRYVSLY